VRRVWVWSGLLAVVWLLQGCAATGPKGTEMASTLNATAPGYGRIVFFRSAGFAGGAVQPDIKLDGQVVGQSKPGGFFYAEAGPGKRVIEAATETASRLEITVMPGQTYYVRSAISMGLMVGRIALTQEGQVTAQTELPGLSYTGGTPVKVGAPGAGAAISTAAAAKPAVELPPLKRGDQLVYRVTDQMTGLAREVVYAVDRVDAERVHFNQGGRVEAKDGSLLSKHTPLAGEMDACSPPSGWVKPGQTLGAAWSTTYQKSAAGACWGDFTLQARVVSEDPTPTPFGELTLQRVDSSVRVQRTGRYVTFHRMDSRAWWSPALRRIVRFESEVVPLSVGVTASRELVELIEVRRD